MKRPAKNRSRRKASANTPRWNELVKRVTRGGERVIVRQTGMKSVGLVPVADIRLLEALEDEIDAAEVARILKTAKPSDFLPIERLKVRLGL